MSLLTYFGWESAVSSIMAALNPSQANTATAATEEQSAVTNDIAQNVIMVSA